MVGILRILLIRHADVNPHPTCQVSRQQLTEQRTSFNALPDDTRILRLQDPKQAWLQRMLLPPRLQNNAPFLTILPANANSSAFGSPSTGTGTATSRSGGGKSRIAPGQAICCPRQMSARPQVVAAPYASASLELFSATKFPASPAIFRAKVVAEDVGDVETLRVDETTSRVG